MFSHYGWTLRSSTWLPIDVRKINEGAPMEKTTMLDGFVFPK